MTDYLIHYGVKGMKWGVRHDPIRGSLSSRKGMSTAKKIAIGAAIVGGTVLVGYGAYKIQKIGVPKPFTVEQLKDMGISTFEPERIEINKQPINIQDKINSVKKERLEYAAGAKERQAKAAEALAKSMAEKRKPGNVMKEVSSMAEDSTQKYSRYREAQKELSKAREHMASVKEKIRSDYSKGLITGEQHNKALAAEEMKVMGLENRVARYKKESDAASEKFANTNRKFNEMMIKKIESGGSREFTLEELRELGL